jgi:hypothetical protein
MSRPRRGLGAHDVDAALRGVAEHLHIRRCGRAVCAAGEPIARAVVCHLPGGLGIHASHSSWVRRAEASPNRRAACQLP